MSDSKLPPERRIPPARRQARMTHVFQESKRVRRFALPKLSRVRGSILVAAGTAAVIAVIALSPFGNEGGSANPVLERAYAAVSRPDVIWHVKWVQTNPDSARKPFRGTVMRTESWFKGSEQFHSIVRSRFRHDASRPSPGVRIPSGPPSSSEEEFASDGKEAVWYSKGMWSFVPEGISYGPVARAKASSTEIGFDLFSASSEPIVSPAQLFKAASKKGKVLHEGEIDYHGTPAYEVTVNSTAVQHGVPSTKTIVIDRQTYHPLAVTDRIKAGPGGGGNFPTISGVLSERRYTLVEALPATARNTEFLKMRPHPGVPSCRLEEPGPPANCPGPRRRAKRAQRLFDHVSRLTDTYMQRCAGPRKRSAKCKRLQLAIQQKSSWMRSRAG